MDRPLNWFEIPVTDLTRARTFYETVLGVPLTPTTMQGVDLAVFPYERERHTGGTLILQPGLLPSADGIVLYLNAGAELAPVLERVVSAGGAIVTPTTALPPGMGVWAHIRDTEGNRVGLHATA